MRVAGIIAEFNPFHNGHKYLIDNCRKELGADRIVVVMSGDYVQRGAPAIMDKFSRTRMALLCGADLVLELPVCYSLGSAEYFAEGAVGILDGLGCVDFLCFGAENPDISGLVRIADIPGSEPEEYRDALNLSLREGESFAVARARGICAALKALGDESFLSDKYIDELVSLPNNILATEYIKALKRRKSRIQPYAIRRSGAGYHSLEKTEIMSASGVRARLLSGDSAYIKEKAFDIIKGFVPDEIIPIISDYKGYFLDSNNLSMLLYYKLLSEKQKGYTKYLDVGSDLSNRIRNSLENFDSFTYFCQHLKTKNLTYTRISRSLLHILLNITDESMKRYRLDNFTCYARILGMSSKGTDLVSRIGSTSSIPVIERLKTAKKLLDPLQLQLFDETLTAGSIYNAIAENEITSEFRLKPIIQTTLDSSDEPKDSLIRQQDQ